MLVLQAVQKDLNIYCDSKCAVSYYYIVFYDSLFGFVCGVGSVAISFLYYFSWPQMDSTANAKIVQTI